MRIFVKKCFFDLFACKILKKVSRNQESIGCSKRFLSILCYFLEIADLRKKRRVNRVTALSPRETRKTTTGSRTGSDRVSIILENT